jgi:hypothetical protein
MSYLEKVFRKRIIAKSDEADCQVSYVPVVMREVEMSLVVEQLHPYLLVVAH